MAKGFEINGIKYTIENTVAIADCDERKVENKQECLLVKADNGIEIVRHHVFGWKMPETKEDFLSMCEDYNVWESCEENFHIKIIRNGIIDDDSIVHFDTETEVIEYCKNTTLDKNEKWYITTSYDVELGKEQCMYQCVSETYGEEITNLVNN